MIVGWIERNVDSEMCFSLIRFQLCVVRVCIVEKAVTSRYVDEEHEKFFTHQSYLVDGPSAAEMLGKRMNQVEVVSRLVNGELL